MSKLSNIYWSKQHGAYITLITAWIASVAACVNFNFLQPIILIFLLAGLNFSELFAEKIKRKSPLPVNKKFWLLLYFLITAVTGIIILFYHPLMKYFVFIGMLSAIFYTVSSKKRIQKTVVSELILFALFALFGLLAYLPKSVIDMNLIFHLFLAMFLYFSVSIFTIKARFNKINRFAPLYYLIVSVSILYIAGEPGFFFNAVSILIFIKAMFTVVFFESYKRLKISTIGIFESVTHLLFILIFLLP